MTEELPWPFAGRVAGLIAGEHDLARSYHFQHLASTMPSVVAEASAMVTAATGLELPGDPSVAVVTRREWVERNLGGFTKMVGSGIESSSIGDSDRPGAAVARRLVAGEIGALLGFLSKRVLGQYELVLPSEDDADSIAFVGGNILSMERSNQFSPTDFRMWIALHESAHRAQFKGIPWMRDYFQELIGEMVESSTVTRGRLKRMANRVRIAHRDDEPIIDERGLMGFVATPAQSETLDKIQALMSLLEGHGHFVMDRIGERVLTSQARMSSILKRRRNDPKVEALYRLTGIQMKMKQYEEGEEFVAGVEKVASFTALNAAWRSPEHLPTLAEIRDPESWLERVG